MIQNCKICSVKKINYNSDIYDGLCKECSIVTIAYNRYFESNIPLEYWYLDMNKDFNGSKSLMDVYSYITNDFKKAYFSGFSICLAGQHGTGKTLASTCILKKAAQKNYSCLYSTLSDIVNSLTLPSNEEKFLARRELMTVDFLVIDEFDPRFMGTENAADLFGKTLEHIFRTRTQNKLPTIMCSNSPNPIESFNGSIKQSIESLFSRIKIVPIIGNDFRKEQGNAKS